jgi:hypothetical protein
LVVGSDTRTLTRFWKRELRTSLVATGTGVAGHLLGHGVGYGL